MKTIEFNCPNCQQHFEAGAETAGQPVICPNCQTHFVSPKAMAAAIPEYDYEETVQKKTASEAWEKAEALENEADVLFACGRWALILGAIFSVAAGLLSESGEVTGAVFASFLLLSGLLYFFARLVAIHAAILRLRK
ncbi:MAG TPA: hypothetical protein VFC44_13330 [Candidatus Saccharimonadales bacterium]|nr:hypothetical protein [Candidatus Saccharimonadales bacterium]